MYAVLTDSEDDEETRIKLQTEACSRGGRREEFLKEFSKSSGLKTSLLLNVCPD